MKILHNRQFQYVLGLLVLDILLFTTTNAATAPSFVAIIGFGLLVVTVFYVIYALTGLTKYYGLPVPRRKPLSIYLTAIIGLLVALQSIGELGPRDVMVILLLAGIGYVYSSYAKTAKRNEA
jgi:predicted membrane protein